MRIRSVLLAAMLAVTSIALPTYAQETFSSASELIMDVVKTSLTGITSSTMDQALSYVESKISTDGVKVLYDGSVIGYWESSTVYTDSEKSSTVIAPASKGYKVDNMLLHDVLTDVNEKLIENYVPTTDDWSKIVGKYDITLGDITVPADHWVELEPDTNPLGTGKVLNITKEIGCSDGAVGKEATKRPYASAWIIDNNGVLYLQSGIYSTLAGVSASNTISPTIVALGIDNIGTVYWMPVDDNGTVTVGNYGSLPPRNLPIHKVGLYKHDGKFGVGYYICDAAGTNKYINWVNVDKGQYNYHKLTDSTIKYSGDFTDIKAQGIMWFDGITSLSNATRDNMFYSYSSSKLVKGNSRLSKRILKLPSLQDSDILTVSADGWTINGTQSFDTYFGLQQLVNAGDTADINAVADVEPMNFNVIVPTTLPVYVDSAGVTTTASNASILNKSNAAVKTTEISIVEKPESGWTLVQGEPSSIRDSFEFSFTTSLTKDTVLAKGEELPFTYKAQLSPITDGADSLDLATVKVTVDWAN